MTDKVGVMVCGHGSRDAGAVAEFAAVAATVRQRLPDHQVEHGYLEFARPVIADGLERLRATGDPRATGGGDAFDEYPYLGGAPRHPSLPRLRPGAIRPPPADQH